MASRGARLFAFFFFNEKKKGRFGAPPQELLHKPKGGAKGLKFGKWYAHEMRTGNKILFCSPRIKIATYHQPLFFIFVVGTDKEEYIRQQRRPEKD